jgi:hypothetical protein
VDNGIHRLRGGEFGKERAARSSGLPLFSFHWSRPAPANDNVPSLGWRLRRWLVRLVLGAAALGAVWAAWA